MTPLEAVARAIYAADPQLGPNGPVPWDQQHTPLRAVCIAQARAAIEAIREPSRDMLRAAWTAYHQNNVNGLPKENVPDAMWKAMIDTLLAEP